MEFIDLTFDSFRVVYLIGNVKGQTMQQLSIELTPENLWNKLKALDPLMPRDTAPSIEMLRQAYQENRQREDSQVVLKLFESALDNWTNEEIK